MHDHGIRRLVALAAIAFVAVWVCPRISEAAEPAPNRPTTAEPSSRQKNDPLVNGVGTVLAAITDAARRNQQRQTDGNPPRLSGDRLCELYVREAAKAAAELPREVAHKAFLLALGMAVDRQAALSKVPIVGLFCRRMESKEQHERRLGVLGTPGLYGRHDLAQHFFVSCALTVLVGREQAESVGLSKEIADSRGKSGFSFADLTADMSGVAFASAVGDGKLPLKELATSFTIESCMPEIDSPEEGIAWEDFVKTYGHPADPRFKRKQTSIRKQIEAMPAYSKTRSVEPRTER